MTAHCPGLLPDHGRLPCHTLLPETGDRDTLKWCHDDQPVHVRTRDGSGLEAMPCPLALNDVPRLVACQTDRADFAHVPNAICRRADALEARS